jgi:hypothetical protein
LLAKPEKRSVVPPGGACNLSSHPAKLNDDDCAEDNAGFKPEKRVVACPEALGLAPEIGKENC